jgi:hypothetical protein
MTDKDIHLEMEPRKDSASHLQRQLSVPEASIALKWSNLTAVAPASFSWRQRLCGTEDAPRPKDKVILQNGTYPCMLVMPETAEIHVETTDAIHTIELFKRQVSTSPLDLFYSHGTYHQ